MLSILKYDFELWVGGDDLDMYPQLEDGVEPMRAIPAMYALGAKNGS